MAKRVLVVSQHYWPETFRITDICETWAAQGIEVDVLCGLPNYPKGEFFGGYSWNGPFDETHNGVHIYRAKEVRRKGNTSWRIFWNYISFPFFARFRIRKLLKNNYDAIFSYETSPVFMAYPALWFAKKTKTPCTIYVLDLWPENLFASFSIQNKLLRRILTNVSLWHYKKADRLIAMSATMQNMLAHSTGKNKDDIAVIPQYSEDFYATRPIPSPTISSFFPNDTFNIMFAGNISPAQSLDTLVLAAKQANETLPNKVHYVIVGDGMYRTELEALCNQHGISHLFTFTGQYPATDIPAFQVAADALFVALNKSMLGVTIPAKVASYCAAGKPILASMDGEGAHVIDTSACGYSSPAEDAFALAENIQRIAQLSQAELAKMGENGFDYYEHHFQKSLLLGQLEDFIFDGKVPL